MVVVFRVILFIVNNLLPILGKIILLPFAAWAVITGILVYNDLNNEHGTFLHREGSKHIPNVCINRSALRWQLSRRMNFLRRREVIKLCIRLRSLFEFTHMKRVPSLLLRICLVTCMNATGLP